MIITSGGRNCGKTKRMQDFVAEAVKRGEKVCFLNTRHEQKTLRGAGHPWIDLIIYMCAKGEQQ